MYEKIMSLDGYFKSLSNRPNREVYFYRLSGYSEKINLFIRQYYEAARKNGIVIEGNIKNPTESNLTYYEEIMGMDFQMSVGFFFSSLNKWLPRMSQTQRNNVAVSIYDALDVMRREGKNQNMLKNTYVKFMCWFYYRFEEVVSRLGDDNVPKILYEGTISRYELMLLAVLSASGCDVVLLQYQGDVDYLRLDPSSACSTNYVEAGMCAFPEGYSIKQIRREMENEIRIKNLCGGEPKFKSCTNAWISGRPLEDILTVFPERGTNPSCFYNCFIRINGVEDKLTCLNEWYQFQLQLKNENRKIIIMEHGIMKPNMEEISSVKRKNYGTSDQMIADLTGTIFHPEPELQKLMRKFFVEILTEECKKLENNLNRLTNKAVYLLCWLRRYQQNLFGGWKAPQIACFILLGGCNTDNEALFVRMLSHLPTDVLILNSNLNHKCCLEDRTLYEQNFPDSLEVDRFPQENADIRMGTAAYFAERELDTLLYDGTGMYRNQQYNKAVTVTLQTMYEEILILWDQELKYRPNFGVTQGIANIPVIFAKISGVKDGKLPQYWAGIKQLLTEDAILIRDGPYIKTTDPNPMKPYMTEFFKDGVLQKNRIKSHKAYQYGYLREEIQNYLLDKLQILIERKFIKGTFENGTEYTIVATILNLRKDILRMIQKFDFTRKNPKVIYIRTTETIMTLEDSILMMFLNLTGFDIVFFVPTGYQNIERYFSWQVMEEHLIGEYLYDLDIPELNETADKQPSLHEKILNGINRLLPPL